MRQILVHLAGLIEEYVYCGAKGDSNLYDYDDPFTYIMYVEFVQTFCWLYVGMCIAENILRCCIHRTTSTRRGAPS